MKKVIYTMALITAMIINSVISVYGAPQISVTENIPEQENVAKISEKSQHRVYRFLHIWK